MENGLLNSVMVISSPNLLPEENHDELVSNLCSKYDFVILMQFGDEKYSLSLGYELPINARVLYYDYETLDEAVTSLERYFNAFGIGITSRHKNQDLPLPFVLTGSILKVPTSVDLKFFNRESILNEKPDIDILENEWDL